MDKDTTQPWTRSYTTQPLTHSIPPSPVPTTHPPHLQKLTQLHDQWTHDQHPGTVVVIHGSQHQTLAELVRDWRKILVRNSTTVFEASCKPRTTYGALRSLVLSLYGHLEDAGLADAAVQNAFEALSNALGVSHWTLEPTPPARSTPGPIFFYELLGRFFTEATQRTPSTLIIQNLHQADSASLAAILYLAQNFALDPINAFIPDGVNRPGLHTLLVLTSQDNPPHDALLETLKKRLKDHQNTNFIDTKGLDRTNVERFLQSEKVVRHVLQATGGRPSALQAWLQHTPAQHSNLTLARLQDQPPLARHILQALAVYGRPATPDILIQILQDSQAHHVGPALSSLVSNGLLTRNVTQGLLRLDFADPSIAKTLYRTLSDEESQRLHRRTGELLTRQQHQGQPIALEEIAHHFLRSDDTTSAVQTALEASQRLFAGFAYEPARDLLVRVQDLVRDEHERSDILTRLIDIEIALHNHEDALQHCQTLLDTTPASEQHAGVWRRIGRIRLSMGMHDQAIQALQNALQILDDPKRDPHHESIQTLTVLAEVHLAQGNHTQTVEVCQQGLDAIPESTQDLALLRLRLDLTNTLGKVCLFREDYEQARTHFQSGRQEAALHSWHEGEVRALFNLGTIAVQQREYDSAESIFRECLAFGPSTANPIIRASCLLNLAVIYQKTRRYSEALDCYLHGLATFKMSGNDLQFAVTAMNLAVLYQLLNDLPKAKALSTAAAEVARAHNMRYIHGRCRYVQATLALEDSAYTEALEHLRAAEDNLENPGRAMRSRLALFFAYAHHGLQQHDERNRHLEHIDIHIDSAEGRELHADKILAESVFSNDRDDWTQGERLARQARSLYREQSVQDKTWKANVEIARACRATRRPQEGLHFVREALDDLHDLARIVPEPLRESYLQTPAIQRLLRLQRALEGRTSLDPQDSPSTPSTQTPALPKPDNDRAVLTIRTPQHKDPSWRARFANIVGEDPRLHHLFRMVEKVAQSDSTVLLTGPSGTGKELFAESIHTHSPRAHQPLIKVNCAAFVETLLLSELFGHEKGSFTGALSRKKGRFELAHKGTLFLDEIGDISLNTQVSLLRVLQERQFERVGGNKLIDVDVRVVAATNRNLEKMVREGTFRLDLYYRLKGVMLELPALKERRADIPWLVRHFTERFSNPEHPQRFSHDALRLLASYNWPGNIRELENFTRSILLFVDAPIIRVEDLREFNEFFAHGEMCEDPPILIFEDGWWSGPDDEPCINQTPSDGTQLAQDSNEACDPQQHSNTETDPTPTDTTTDDEHTPVPQKDPETRIVEQVVHEGLNLQQLKKRLEIECIRHALIETEGNITHAARLLQMKRPRLSQIINANSELETLKNSFS